MVQVLSAYCFLVVVAAACGQDHGDEPDTSIKYFSEDASALRPEMENADINKRPYMMHMRMKPKWYKKSVHCEAVAVDDSWVMTSARCCVKDCGTPYEPGKICLRSGSADMDNHNPEHKIERVMIKDGYIVNGMNNNICLMKLSATLHFGRALKALVLAVDHIATGGAVGVITGWSKKDGGSSNPLISVSLPMISNERCKQLWGNPNDITDGMMCAVTESSQACHGVGGSPFVVDGKLAGIVTSGTGCGNKPAVYTSISHHKDWILRQMGIDQSNSDIDVRANF